MLRLFTLGRSDLRGEDDAPVDGVLSGPKRLALLTYLALARPRGFHRRDTLLPLLWPESDQQHARGALRNLLHQTRNALGKGVILSRGSEEIGLAEGALWCDAAAFEHALDEGHPRKALDLYRGDVLGGFHVPDASPAFQHWLDGERNRLRRRAAGAAWTMAEEAEEAGSITEATHWAHRAVDLSPWDEAAIHRLLLLLERGEGPTGALRAYEEYARRLHEEWKEEPGAEIQALVEKMREHRPTLSPRTSRSEVDARNASLDPEVYSPARASESDRRLPAPAPATRMWPPGSARRVRGVAILGGVAVFAAVVITLVRSPAPRADVPVIAVGHVEALGASDTTDLAPALRNLIAATLARSPDLQVIGVERLQELVDRENLEGRPGATWSQAARHAGAEFLLNGVLHIQPDGHYRLSLARQHLATGRTTDAVTARGSDLYVLAEQATTEMLSDLGISAPPFRVAGAITRSPAAFRFYEEGLRAYYAGDNDTAYRLLSAALAQDSAFAMAVYYRALSREEVDHQSFLVDLRRAAHLSGLAPDRERLLILSAWAQEMDEPRQLALADTLAIRYPHEPDGHLFLGKAQLWNGDFANALPHLRRVVQMDSLGLTGDASRCRACDALQDIVTAHLLADSLAQAETVARWWMRQRPGSARAWHYLARTLEYQGRNEEALEARDRAAALRADNPRDVVYPAVLAIRSGDFHRADSTLAALQRSGASLVQQNILWYQTLSLREQGRLEEALGAARRYRDMVLRAETPAQRRPWESVLEAVVLQEIGHPREAAQIWHAMADYPYEPESPARTARHRAWTLTHLASALAATGDTVQLPELADTIQALGANSAYGRDPRLHDYVRGLHLLARGDTTRAVDAFRRAVFSLTAGYGRINLELGRALLALGQPQEAAQVLGAVLRGPLDAGNLYASQSEIRSLVARARQSAGRRDSARSHERWTARARHHLR